MADDDKIFPFVPRSRPTNDSEFQAAATLFDWVAEMKRQGRCPTAVSEALLVLFNGPTRI